MMELLKQSLGESVIPISENFWNWKHEQNPFGPSYVLLAEEAGQLIGLRAFMQWQWQWRNQTLRAIRAVDTATHPAFQGRGIFKTLTLQLLETCQQQNIQFVFNTPNEKSRPGYLKMGWVEQARMPLKLKTRNAAALLVQKILHCNKQVLHTEDLTPQQDWRPLLSFFSTFKTQPIQELQTVMTPAYLSWRYAGNPLYRYYYFTDHEHVLVVGRIKRYSFTKELRIVDFILLNGEADPKKVNRFVKKTVSLFCREQRVNLVSISGAQFRIFKPYLRWMGFLPVKPWGPLITLRNLNMSEGFAALRNPDNWAYSLGDMELF